mmetsp:Transcript_1924/g.2748  ORF Transcript_1924/g.2748 Transcript_1924/m.2748 type:complete len:167 (+) Transcript_1924:676-1176(+)
MSITRNTSEGLPIIDLTMSQGGKPCLHSTTEVNAMKNKQEFRLYPENYQEGCPNYDLFGKTYKESQLYHKIPNSPPVSEYTIVKENNDGKYYKMMRKFRSYDLQKLKGYSYELYSKSYHHWSGHCSYDGSSKVENDTAPVNVTENQAVKQRITPSFLEESLHHKGT